MSAKDGKLVQLSPNISFTAQFFYSSVFTTNIRPLLAIVVVGGVVRDASYLRSALFLSATLFGMYTSYYPARARGLCSLNPHFGNESSVLFRDKLDRMVLD